MKSRPKLLTGSDAATERMLAQLPRWIASLIAGTVRKHVLLTPVRSGLMLAWIGLRDIAEGLVPGLVRYFLLDEQAFPEPKPFGRACCAIAVSFRRLAGISRQPPHVPTAEKS